MSKARKSSVDPVRRPLTKAHIPYRADDLTHGKKTGVTVREVDRRSDGFEPFGEVLYQADDLTPPNAKTKRRRRSPSQVSEPEENGEVSMDLDNSAIASPNIYFNNAPRPSAPTSANRTVLSNRSSNRSSIVNYDDIPTPRASSLQRARVPINGSTYSTPRNKSKLSEAMVVPSSPDSSDDNGGYDGGTYNDAGNDFGYDGGGDDTFQYDQPDDQPPEEASPQEARTSFSTMNQDTSDLPAPEGPPIPSPPRPKQNGRDKRKISIAEEEADVEEEDARRFEDAEEMQIDEGVELDDEIPQSSKRAAREERPKPKKAPAKRKKVQVLEPVIDQDDRQSGGVRRSSRQPMKPLKWWMGERVVYGRRETGVTMVPVIKDVIRLPQEVPEPLGHKNRRGRSKPRSRSKSAVPDGEGEDEADPQNFNPEEGWDDATDPQGIVLDFLTGNEVQRRLAFTSKMINPQPSASKEFLYQKIFGDGEFIAAGYIVLPVGGKKPSKQSKDNAYVFYVVEGALQLKLHRTSFVIASGGTFLVPRGNTYYLENIAARPTKLFFAQARKVRVEDLDVQGQGDAPAGGRSKSAAALRQPGRSSSVAAAATNTPTNHVQPDQSKRAVSK